VEGGDRQQAGIIGGHLHHLDERATRLSPAMEQVMAAAARPPAATAALEKAQRVFDRSVHSHPVGSPEAMIAGPRPDRGLRPRL